MSQANKELLHRWFEEVWNKGRSDAIDEMFAVDGVAHGLADDSGQPLRGPANFKAFHQKFREALTGIVVTVEDTVAEGDKIAARCRVCGQHTGDSLGVAATNKAVEITGMTMLRVKEGKIVEAWNNFDFLSLYQQMGAI